MASEPQVSVISAPDVRVTNAPIAAMPGAGSEYERCVSQIRLLFPTVDFGIRFLLADRRGHLRTTFSEGRPLRLGPRQASRRRSTFADGITRIVEGTDGRGVGIFPIDRRGQALGVAEVTAPVAALDRWRWDVEAALGRCSSTLRHRAERRELDIGLAWTAHEMRGPLRAAQLWLRNAVSADHVEARDHVVRAIEELSRLADGMDSVLRWAAGAEKLHRTRVDLVTLAHQAVDCCVAETGQDRVVVEGAGSLLVRVDELHLRSAIENLVRNALQHSDPGTKVLVTVELRGDAPTVEVENEGPGISKEERRTIFEPLAHGGSGTGLGLFVADRVVERHGGAIRCHQPAEGRVAFELSLPPEARP